MCLKRVAMLEKDVNRIMCQKESKCLKSPLFKPFHSRIDQGLSPCKCSAGRPVEGGCIDGIRVNGTTSINLKVDSHTFKPWKCQGSMCRKGTHIVICEDSNHPPPGEVSKTATPMSLEQPKPNCHIVELGVSDA